MAEVLLPTAAFDVGDGGPFALSAWNFGVCPRGCDHRPCGRLELVSVEGRVLVFENLGRIRDFFGHLMGRGMFGNKALGRAMVMNMEPVAYTPKAFDMWSREWYAKHAGDESPTDRRRAGLGGVVYTGAS